MLELGAGCGLVGMLGATLGAHVTLTDRANVVQHIQANTDLNLSDQGEAALPLHRALRSRCSVAPLK